MADLQATGLASLLGVQLYGGDTDELLLTTFPPSTVPTDGEFRLVI